MTSYSKASTRTAVSYQRDPIAAARELSASLMGDGLGFVLFFCSTEYDLQSLGQALDQEFSGIQLAGCTTAGEITPDGYGQGCITAVGFGDQHFRIAARLILDIENFTVLHAQDLVSDLLRDCRAEAIAPIKGNTFALTLLDGLSSLEERVLEALNTAFGSIRNFGGSAGDDRRLSDTYVYFGGRFYTDAAIVVVVNTLCDFDVFTTHHMVNREQKLVVTKTDSKQRRVYEFNAEPAASAYAKAVNVPVDELDHLTFALEPVGVKIGRDYYVRSIQQAHPDQSMTFYCAIENGIVLTRMQPRDMLDNLKNEFDRARRTVGEPQLILGCDCFLNRVEMEHRGLKEEASEFMKAHKVVGFCTYGEQIGGVHVNQTFTGVAIGAAPAKAC